mgnify:FL=1
MNVSLTTKLEEFVRRKVASGLYNKDSEVIREGLRLLVEREAAAAATQPERRPDLDVVRGQLATLEKPLREKGITSLALFGSIIHGNARPDSDIDVLVDIDPKSRFSLVSLVSVKNFLEERLGRPVDVVTRTGIEPTIKDRVFGEAERVF